jgi:NADPH:quinone reductase-like Zn-dependent oxidoreductase
MKAVFLKKYGKADEAFEIRETAQPEIKDRQVLVKVEGFGLNFADVVARNGLYREAPPLPCVLGYEAVGRVEKVGAEVDASWVGKRVLAFTRFGGYAEYVASDYRGVVEIPEEMPLPVAVAMGTQYATAYYGIMHSLRLMPGDAVLIHAAAGGVGLALVQFALHLGCEIVATAGSQEKLDFLKSLGVHHVINYRETDYSEAAKRALGKKRFMATFNSLAGNSLKKDMELLGSGGALVCFGGAARMGKKGGIFATINFLFQSGFMSPLFMMMKSKSVIGINMLKLADYRPEVVQHCLKSVVEMYRNGEIKPHSGQEFSVNEIAKAHHMLGERDTIGKIAVKW